MTVTELPPTTAPTFWSGLDAIPRGWEHSVVSLGVFDGMHRGHVSLLRLARELARAREHPLVVLTFDPHPAAMVGPPRDTTPITSLERRVELARLNGADEILVLPFTSELATMSPEAFVEDVLVDAIGATDVVVGGNFRFGRNGAGDLAKLQSLGDRHRFLVHSAALVPGCSSTQVRRLVASGAVESAAALLGRPYSVHGVVGEAGLLVNNALRPSSGLYWASVRGVQMKVEVRDEWLLFNGDVALGPAEVEFTRCA